MNEIMLVVGLIIFIVSDVIWSHLVMKKLDQIDKEIEIININMKK